jgi:hypothetical protein
MILVPPLAPIDKRQRPRRPRAHKVVRMGAGHYRIIAEAVRTIEDAAVRHQVADHFARFFLARSDSFDPAQWERATRGTARQEVRP